MSTLYFVDHDRGEITEAALEGLTAARAIDASVAAVTVGSSGDVLADKLFEYGAAAIHQIHHDELSDYAPVAWGDAVCELASSVGALAVIGVGTDRGSEVMAHVAAAMDLLAGATADSAESLRGLVSVLERRLSRFRLPATADLIRCNSGYMAPISSRTNALVRERISGWSEKCSATS